MNTLDIIVIAVISISAVIGLVKGFIKTVFGFASMILAVLLTIFLTPQISSYIVENTAFDEMISEKAIELLNIKKDINIDVSDVAALDTIEDLSLPGNVVESLVENMTPQVVNVLDVTNVVDYIGSSIASMAVNALVFLVLFIVISLLLNAIVTLLDLVSQLPVLDQMNKMGGFLVGVLFGVLIVWIGTLGLSFIISIQATTELSELIEASILTRLFYYNNPLQNFVMDLARSIGL